MMCGSMVDIQLPTAENRREKKKKEERKKKVTTAAKYNGLTLLWAVIINNGYCDSSCTVNLVTHLLYCCTNLVS